MARQRIMTDEILAKVNAAYDRGAELDELAAIGGVAKKTLQAYGFKENRRNPRCVPIEKVELIKRLTRRGYKVRDAAVDACVSLPTAYRYAEKPQVKPKLIAKNKALMLMGVRDAS